MIFIIILANALINTAEIQSYMASKGVEVRIQAANLGQRTLGNELNYFNVLKSVIGAKRKNTIVLVDPFMQGNQEYLLGFTSKDFAMCVYNERNEKGQDRKLHSLACIAHELSHMARLEHTKGCISLTDEAVMACPNLGTLGFLPEELKKLNRYF